MSAGMVWGNVMAYTLQVGMVAGLGAVVPAILRMRTPRWRLLYWQVLLAACLALPLVRSWRQEVVSGTAQMGENVTTLTAASAPAQHDLPWSQIALCFLAIGVAIRLGWLVVGFVRLAGYRAKGRTMASPPGMRGARLLLCDGVGSPVTFGWRDPVILLPAGFRALPAQMQDAILCHEWLHVERCDWVFTIAEEMVRAVLWFHPAIWWVIGEIQLAREQTVDLAVIELTRAKEPYVDALLLMAGASVDLTPAPMFLRRRQLKKRLMDVMKEAGMATISTTRIVATMSFALVALAGVSWMATGAFPLIAAPQVVNDAAGVAVNINGSQLIHRSAVAYPAEALAKGIEGTVVVQARLDANGEVSDATVLSGPDELRKAALQSVLTWHFDKSAALTTRTVNIDFVKPKAAIARSSAENVQQVQQLAELKKQAEAASLARGPMAPAPPAPPPPPGAGKLARIVVNGVSDSARAELLSRLPVKEGDEWTNASFAAVSSAVKAFDSHLTVGLARSSADGGQLELRIGVANSSTAMAPVAQPGMPTFVANNVATAVGSGSGLGMGAGYGGVYSVGNGVTQPALLSKVDPVYTEEARAAKLDGPVDLTIVVGTDGKAEDIQVLKSLGMGLDEKAVEAVQQWVFRPGTIQGVPVKVRAQVEVNFRLL